MPERASRQSVQDLLGEHTRLFSLPLSDGIPVGDDPLSNVRWHKIGVEGEWEGHWMGPFALSRRDFEQAALQQRSRAIKTLVDYEHKSVLAMFTAAESRAAGWADTLDVRDAADSSAELWARIAWTPNAAQAIRNQEYAYTSPVFRWHTPDRISGADLGMSVPSIALTNTPFLHELPEVTLNSLGMLSLPWRAREVAMFNDTQLKRLLSTLSLGEGATADEVLATLAEREQDGQALEQIGAALGLQAGSEAEVIVATAQALRARAQAAPEPSEMQALRQQVTEMRVATALKEATQQGKIVASNRDWAEGLAKRDPKLFADWAASAPVVVPVGAAKRPPSHGADSDAIDGPMEEAQLKRCASALSALQLRAAKQGGLTPEQFVKYGLTAEQQQGLLAG